MIVAFVVALAATPVAARLARRLGIVDHPGPLKVQAEPIPYLGGVAALAGLAAVLVPTRPALLIPLGAALVLGLADDAKDIQPRIRLIGEVVIGLAAAAVCPVRGPLGVVVTAGLVVVLLNAVNLLDGLDGLAAGIGVVSAAGFALTLADPRVLALSLGGALAGFLVFNRPPARIYLGDAGSYLVGTALALLAAHAVGAGRPAALGCGALLFVVVPLLDTAVAIVRRLRARLPLFTGDRGHIYDQLVDRDRSPAAATAICVCAQLVLSAVGVAATQLAPPTAGALTAATIAVAVGAVAVGGFTSPSATWRR